MDGYIEIVVYASAALSAALLSYVAVSLYNRFDFSSLDAGEEKGESPFLVRAVLPLARPLGEAIIGRNKGQTAKALMAAIERMLVTAGEPAGLVPQDIVGLAALGCPAGSLAGASIHLLWPRFTVPCVLAGMILGASLPFIWLNDRIKRRQKEIKRGLPYCLDLITLAVEAGMDFTTALQLVSEKLQRFPALAFEIKRTLRAIQMGRMRAEALRDLARRAALPEVSSVTAAIIQADELGADLGPILRIQSEQIRINRFQTAEKLAMEAPVKMLLPLIAFLFPTTLIVIFGPLIAGILSRRMQ